MTERRIVKLPLPRLGFAGNSRSLPTISLGSRRGETGKKREQEISLLS
jgi:hypothetical protein